MLGRVVEPSGVQEVRQRRGGYAELVYGMLLYVYINYHIERRQVFYASHFFFCIAFTSYKQYVTITLGCITVDYKKSRLPLILTLSLTFFYIVVCLYVLFV